jgi:hypothetical protein
LILKNGVLVGNMVGMELSVQAYQRLLIATHLVNSSFDSLAQTNHMVADNVPVDTIENLAVALYELRRLSQDLTVLLADNVQKAA